MNELIDIVNIYPDKYSSVEAFNGIELKGKYDNVAIVVSFGYVCHRYTSPFCKNKCHAIPKIEYCDYETGNPYCINGANNYECEKNGLVFLLIKLNPVIMIFVTEMEFVR
ncbi:LOW QUALITY PROTEIN: hypothetical protein HZS_7264 [Henneguya salminicola]|nr:LOW QUALITY PROTEIN: hypothetical protein HZS_7264 [Henneguya salminicola]